MIRLACANIERSTHLDAIERFLKEQQPDIFCLQEVVQGDLERLASLFEGTVYEYAPMLRHLDVEGNPIVGVGVFSRLPARTETIYYVGDKDSLPDHTATEDRGRLMNCALAVCEAQKGNETYKVATTHFAWSAHGLVDDNQRQSVRLLLAALASQGEIVVCGDFNAPRGGEIFSTIAGKYKDNIPLQYKTSIDLQLHRAGHLPEEKMDQKMVDGLFSTPAYAVSDVELHSGISDHLAITATISKAKSARSS